MSATHSTKIVPPPVRMAKRKCIWCGHVIEVPRLSAAKVICKCGRTGDCWEPVE